MTDPSIDPSPGDLREHLARAGVFIRRTLRFWRLALSVCVVGGLACFAVLSLRRPSYRSEAVILYSEGVRLAEDSERRDSSRSVTLRLKEILMSRATLDRVGREFDLYPEIRRAQGPVDAVEELRRHLEFRSPGGDTFSIAFTGSSPEEAQNVTRRLGELVLDEDSGLRKNLAFVTRDFLEGQRRSTLAELRAREEDLASFMALHPRFAFDVTPLSNGAAIRASLGPTGGPPPAPASRAFSGASVPPGVAPLPASPARAPGDGVHEAALEVGRATAAVAAARANLSELSTRFTAAHPDVRAAQAELERASTRAAAATSEARGTLEPVPGAGNAPPRPTEPAAARPVRRTGPAAQPAASLPPAPAASATTGMVALETDWVRLTRGVTEARQHEDQVEAALFKANMTASTEAGGQGVQVTVIDPAFLPRTPVPPGRTAIVLGFAVVSLLLGALSAAVRTVVDDRVYDARDLSGISVTLAEVPLASPRRTHVAS